MIPQLATRSDRALVASPLRNAKVYSRTQINSVALAARKVINAEERAKDALHSGTIENRAYDLAFDDYMALLKSYGCAWLALDILTRFEASPAPIPWYDRNAFVTSILIITGALFISFVVGSLWLAFGEDEPGCSEMEMWAGRCSP